MSVLVDGLRHLLAPLETYDGPPAVTHPPTRYVCLYTDTGTESEQRLAEATTRIVTTIQVVCVGRTREGTRALVRDVRARLLNHRPTPTATPIISRGAGPMLDDMAPGDTRLSMTLTLSTVIDRTEL